MTPSVAEERSAPEEQAETALRRGDRRGALEILVNAYGRRIYGYCHRLVRDPHLAEDVLQTTFLQAYDALPRFDGRSSLRTWLFGIAHHRCLDALKARQRWWRRANPLDDVEATAEGGDDVEEDLMTSDLRRALHLCLEKLTPRARAAVMLRFQEGCSYVEMAELCHEAAATLQARVVRALPLLRRCVQAKGITP